MKFLPLLVIAGALALPAGASAKTVWLDSYERSQDGYIGPVSTSTLLDDRRYVLTISGTFSSYSPELWRRGRICGTPTARPRFPSKRRPSGPTGADAMWAFADRRGLCRRRTTTVVPAVVTQLALGKTYRRIGKLLPSYLVFRPDHIYRLAVVGAGRRAKIRIKDPNTRDNYGRLRITVRRAKAPDCSGTNYVTFGFATAAQCAADITKPTTPAPLASAPTTTTTTTTTTP